MAIKSRRDAWKFGAVYAAVHAALILAIALIFYGVESIIEFFLRDIDDIIDVVMAIASTFIFLWLRSIMENARLSEMLRVQSEERTKELERRITEIAHEFQTPLAILKGNVAVLAQRMDGGRIQRGGRGIERANAISVATATLDRLSRLVATLLDVARLNFSKDALCKRPVDVRKLIEEAREDCAILAEDKGIALSTTVSDDPLSVAGDKDKLKEVLLNLLSNALKHTPGGGAISIVATANKYEVEIVIADTGCGISRENLPHLFERFYRIENVGDSTEPSIGLGLHICRQIIEAHGGVITAESELGSGSRFIIHLPLVPAVV